MTMPEVRSPAWVCPICGYVHYGPEPPDECPLCGAPGDTFGSEEERQLAQPAPASAAAPVQVVIVGAGIAGVSAAEAVRKEAPQAEITLISGESYLPYYRLNLTRYLAGEVSESQLPLHPASWYAENRIQLLRGSEVQAIDLAQKELSVGTARRLTFDKLILTLGANPARPPLPGGGRENVTTLRTVTDADFILDACARGQKCVCIGGGFLGLETAAALRRRGAEVTVLEHQPRLLPRHLNEAASALFTERIAALGISLRCGAQTRELTGDDMVRGVALEDGTLLPADLVVISAGVRSNVGLARQAGLLVKQGIVVDSHMQTSHPYVWAAGDVADHQDRLYGLWNPARLQGTAAGLNVAGRKTEFSPLPRSATLKVLGVDLFTIGQIAREDLADRIVENRSDGTYFGFVFRHQFLTGAILLGDASLSPKAKKAIEEHCDCSPLLRKELQVSDVLEYLEVEV